MASYNDITGARLISKASSRAYISNYDRIFKSVLPIWVSIDRQYQDRVTPALVEAHIQTLHNLVNDNPEVVALLVAEFMTAEQYFNTEHQVTGTALISKEMYLKAEELASQLLVPFEDFGTYLVAHVLLQEDTTKAK